MTSPVLGAEQLVQLRDRFQEYSQGSHYRANTLTIRSRAHALIREPETVWVGCLWKERRETYLEAQRELKIRAHHAELEAIKEIAARYR